MLLHKYCSLFPQATADELERIAAGMRATGFDKTHPVITYDGQVLDGQNRIAAAEIARVKPIFKPFKGDEKAALAFVIRENFDRRHLTTSQKAMLAVEFQKCQNSDTSLSEAAKTMKVSRDTAHKAARIRREKPKLAKKVAAGEISINAAIKRLEPRPRVEGINFDAYRSTPAPSRHAQPEPKPEPPKDTRTPGQIAYETHGAMMTDVFGQPDWKAETATAKKAWEAAAQAVLKTVK